MIQHLAVLLLLCLGTTGRAAADVTEADNAHLVAMNFHNTVDDSVELTFAGPVCSNNAQPRTVLVTRLKSTNFDAVISALTLTLLGNFKLKIRVESGTCNLVHVWLKRG